MKIFRVMKESRVFPDRKVDYFQIIEILCEEKGKITHWRKTRLSMKSIEELRELSTSVMCAFIEPILVREIGTDGIERLKEDVK